MYFLGFHLQRRSFPFIMLAFVSLATKVVIGTAAKPEFGGSISDDNINTQSSLFGRSFL